MPEITIFIIPNIPKINTNIKIDIIKCLTLTKMSLTNSIFKKILAPANPFVATCLIFNINIHMFFISLYIRYLKFIKLINLICINLTHRKN